MKKTLLLVLFVLFSTSSAFAACKVEGTGTPLKLVSAEATAPLTMKSGLDKLARNYQEMWVPDRTGKKVRRACDFQCTQDCSYYRDQCYWGGGGQWYCEGQWNLCMCEQGCCWGPGGNPYCA